MKIIKVITGIGIVAATSLFAFSFGKFLGKEEEQKNYE